MSDSLSLLGKRVCVLGAGRTGQAVVRFLLHQQAKVFVSDSSHISNLLKAEWSQWEVDWEEGQHTARVLEADLIIPSPGISADIPVLREANSKEIPVLAEIEVAYQHCLSQKIIAITGTVGKTTTTHLISELLKAHGYPVVTAGNIGRPLIDCLNEIDSETIVVLEVSSYQLEHITSFKPHVGVFTRFAAHHLGRHGSLQEYFQLKCNLFKNQTGTDFAVIHNDIALSEDVHSKIIPFSAQDIQLKNIQLARHQQENLAGALKAAQQIDPALSLNGLDIKQVFQLPHRIEYVAEFNGVRFYNDSKATSPEATQAALETFREKPLVLILGGHDSEGDPLELVQEISRQRIERVLLVGETQGRFARLFQKIDYTRYESVRDLSQAIEISLNLKPKVCLFSPGSPSFDQFRNYEERGDYFKALLIDHFTKTAITQTSDQEAASL
jgi:UDP-N-acetylmuramoylalanine--D-glutamate ligase